MDRSPQYLQGYRHASRDAVALLHATAGAMVDHKAAAVLNTAALDIGKRLKRHALTSSAPANTASAAATKEASGQSRQEGKAS